VNDALKRHGRTCHVGIRETNASEPSMMHRKAVRRHQNWGHSLLPGSAWREPDYWPRGVRCRGGVTLIRAWVWNLGTLHVMPRENSISGTHEGGKYRCTCRGRIIPYERRSACNGRGAKGMTQLKEGRCQPGNRDEPGLSESLCHREVAKEWLGRAV